MCLPRWSDASKIECHHAVILSNVVRKVTAASEIPKKLVCDSLPIPLRSERHDSLMDWDPALVSSLWVFHPVRAPVHRQFLHLREACVLHWIWWNHWSLAVGEAKPEHLRYRSRRLCATYAESRPVLAENKSRILHNLNSHDVEFVFLHVRNPIARRGKSFLIQSGSLAGTILKVEV